ncbi:uncharacterized protein C8orf74 homolog [Notolabrus celidotus]|uniref:uncharacterized protein C8orf74 homolog n=1 Tax=Notolabrus celidotus TaxID=1203425 RepID=UPI00148FC01B|nr:uncharacterized protein C8orf74 homolog [Notolabrus celidotus]
MDSFTEREISQIARQQRDVGLQRLSSHFSWPEFCDDQQRFHQDFVYDVTMYASDRGFPWPDVIRTAVMAKDIFPRLEGLDIPGLLSLLGDALAECFPNITSAQRHEFTNFLTSTCTTRRRLFQAVVRGAVSVTIAQRHLEVELPPTPCPLAQGMDPCDWEHQCHQAKLTLLLQQKAEELRVLREGARVTLGEVSVPEDEELNEQEILALVRTAVRTTQDQMLASLTDEASLLCDIQQIKLQQAALATGGLHNPVLAETSQSSSNLDAPVKASPNSANSKTERRESRSKKR